MPEQATSKPASPLTFTEVTTDQDIQLLARVADEIWKEYWPALIGQAQTDYMVEQFQTVPAITADMAEHGYRYWFMYDADNTLVGYTGGHPEPETNRYFISKIYLYDFARGKGYARQTVEFYDALCRRLNLSAMYLTVNKHNDMGVRAYHGTGFEIVEAVENPIGQGFVMDDYIMQRPVNLQRG